MFKILVLTELYEKKGFHAACVLEYDLEIDERVEIVFAGSSGLAGTKLKQRWIGDDRTERRNVGQRENVTSSFYMLACLVRCGMFVREMLKKISLKEEFGADKRRI